jgi:hypothetical protein
MHFQNVPPSFLVEKVPSGQKQFYFKGKWFQNLLKGSPLSKEKQI